MQIGSIDYSLQPGRTPAVVFLIKHGEHDFVARQITGTQAIFRTPSNLSLVRPVSVHLPDLPFVAARLLSGEKDPGGVEINLRVSRGEEVPA